MAKYLIEFDRETCIGALACNAVAPELWPRSEDGKVDLTGSVFNKKTNRWELVIEEKELRINMESAEVCPVEAIRITKIEDDEGNKVDEKVF